jgi:Tfp pilus assembly protein PilV
MFPVTARYAGMALADVLVALLLLAIAIGGACESLVAATQSSRAALLRLRAVDLGADLSESLLALTSADGLAPLLEAWRAQVRTVLPVAGMEATDFAGIRTAGEAGGLPAELSLRWHDPHPPGTEELVLPLAPPWSPAP